MPAIVNSPAIYAPEGIMPKLTINEFVGIFYRLEALSLGDTFEGIAFARAVDISWLQ